MNAGPEYCANLDDAVGPAAAPGSSLPCPSIPTSSGFGADGFEASPLSAALPGRGSMAEAGKSKFNISRDRFSCAGPNTPRRSNSLRIWSALINPNRRRCFNKLALALPSSRITSMAARSKPSSLGSLCSGKTGFGNLSSVALEEDNGSVTVALARLSTYCWVCLSPARRPCRIWNFIMIPFYKSRYNINAHHLFICITIDFLYAKIYCH